MINQLCIIGVGLIGGSLARALRLEGACHEIVGASRRVEHLQRALDLGVIDRFETNLGKAVKDADMILVATPLGAMESVFCSIAPHVREDTIITDAGSAKASVVQAACTAFGGLPPRLVPGHPIAGTEQSGVEASFPELFKKRRVILTPLEETDPDAVRQVRDMWQLVGAEVIEMSVGHHDAVLAATSHLPHVLAFSLVDSLARMHEEDEIFQYAAGGFRDFTRIASSDPVMWRDICLANREAILSMIDRFSGDLVNLAAALRNGDDKTLLEIFIRAKQARDRHCPQ